MQGNSGLQRLLNFPRLYDLFQDAIDDEALHCLHFAYRARKPGRRFVCFEACWTPRQGFLSRYIMSMDRGQNIRTEQTYRQLAGSVFKNVNAWIETKAMRIPYVIIFLECQ